MANSRKHSEEIDKYIAANYEKTKEAIAKAKTVTYDRACYELAVTFLEDSPAKIRDIPALAPELGQRIQQAIEDFLDEKVLS